MACPKNKKIKKISNAKISQIWVKMVISGRAEEMGVERKGMGGRHLFNMGWLLNYGSVFRLSKIYIIKKEGKEPTKVENKHMWLNIQLTA